MRKVLKIIGIIVIGLIVLYALNQINNFRAKKIIEKADIYLVYDDGNIYNDIPNSGIEGGINIKNKKLYIINWLGHESDFIKFREIESKKLTDSEINELINIIENQANNRVLFDSREHWEVRYNGKSRYIKELPFEVD